MVDVTAIHTGSPSYARDELKAVSARQFAAQVACMVDVVDPNKLDPSPALVKRETAKFNKYSRLLHVAKRQTLEGRRRKEPVFAAFAVTDYGEVGPHSKDLLEWIVHQFKLKCERVGAEVCVVLSFFVLLTEHLVPHE